MTAAAIGINADILGEWLHEAGPSLGLTVGTRKGLADCWAQHPAAVHELTGLFLAWKALVAAITTDPRGPGAVATPGPRDWLDLSNASAAAVSRVIAATATCSRAGHHVHSVNSENVT